MSLASVFQSGWNAGLLHDSKAVFRKLIKTGGSAHSQARFAILPFPGEDVTRPVSFEVALFSQPERKRGNIDPDIASLTFRIKKNTDRNRVTVLQKASAFHVLWHFPDAVTIPVLQSLLTAREEPAWQKEAFPGSGWSCRNSQTPVTERAGIPAIRW